MRGEPVSSERLVSMTDAITEPITPHLLTDSSYRSVTIHDREELRATVAEMLLRKELNESKKVTYIWFTCSQNSAFAQFLDESGRHVVYIDDLRLGYQGTSPGIAQQILLLLGVSPRIIREVNKAAQKAPDEDIEYDIVLEYVEKKGVVARLSADKMHWVLRVE